MTIVFESGNAAIAQLRSWAAVVWASSTTTGKNLGPLLQTLKQGLRNGKPWQIPRLANRLILNHRSINRMDTCFNRGVSNRLTETLTVCLRFKFSPVLEDLNSDYGRLCFLGQCWSSPLWEKGAGKMRDTTLAEGRASFSS